MRSFRAPEVNTPHDLRLDEEKGEEMPDVKPTVTTLLGPPPVELVRYTCGHVDYEEFQRRRLIPLSQVARYVVLGCRAAAVCGGRERALSGCGDRRLDAGQKAVELPPACGQAAQGTRKLETQPRFRFRPPPLYVDGPGTTG